jgi:hypothetical protein
MTTTNGDMLLSFHKQRFARYRIASQLLAQPELAARPIESLNESSLRSRGKTDLSTAFLVVLALLSLATTLFFWNQQRESANRSAEIERQNRVASRVYHIIERYAAAPGAVTFHEAKVAVDLASDEGLTENRQALLSNFYRSAVRCHAGGKYAGSAQDCQRMAYNRFSAMSAALSDDLDADN